MMGTDEQVTCPICQAEVPLNFINKHIDSQCEKQVGETPRQHSVFAKLQQSSSKSKPLDTIHKRPAGQHATDGEQPAKRLSSSPDADAEGRNDAGTAKAPVVEARRKASQPLAEQIRPRSLEEFVGQTQIVGQGTVLRHLLKSDRLVSIILWGPPGCGKTTLAKIVAHTTKAHFTELSAVTSGVADVRNVAQQAKTRRSLAQQDTVLFIDEIHRFSKSQQDALLPLVEKGVVTLIGATTENPSFSCNAALLSRCRVFVLEKLSIDEVVALLTRAITRAGLSLNIDNDTLRCIATACDGDARTALNTLDMVARHVGGTGQPVTSQHVRDAMQKAHLLYDKTGEEHYNCISAMHKSMRGSDADAALYWLARMLEGGEDPRYVTRRMIRFAAEDVGLADPHALVQAVSAHQAAQLIGMPECNVVLAQCAVYLARAPKSNALEVAYANARQCVMSQPAYPVPLHIRNAPTTLMKNLGYGKGYKYNPDYAPSECADQTYLPPELLGAKFMPD